MKRFKGPLALIILDGYAHNPNPQGNAVLAAQRPNLQTLYQRCPWTELVTFGERVGLPDDQMGNSEVGHLNIGAGRVVEQELTRINRALREGSLADNSALKRAVSLSAGRRLHIVGLVSTGGVHSTGEQIAALARSAVSLGATDVIIHAITDGRDRPPTAAKEELVAFAKSISGPQVRVATIIGRYFAMDRDNRWERTQKAYDLFVSGIGSPVKSIEEGLEIQYSEGRSDEFVEPMILSDGQIQENDVIIFANFRADRMRQIVRAFTESPSPLKVTAPKVTVFSLTEYDEEFPVTALFPPFTVRNHLGEVVANAGLRQLRLAETEKYAHVTYFFSGGNEQPLAGEMRRLCPSPKDVATYDLKPKMSAAEVTDSLIRELRSGNIDFAVINFANCDMVGHTGDFNAAVRAVETVDSMLGKILPVLREVGGVAVVTADHGNADQMIDYDTGGPHTFHTKYPVPFILFGDELMGLRLRDGGALCDIAPTILTLLDIPIPEEMTGRSLITS